MHTTSQPELSVKNLFEECLRQVFRARARRAFLIGQLQEIAQDLARLHAVTPEGAHEPAIALATCMTNRIVEMLDGIESRPHRLNEVAFNTLMSWFFPTEDQLHAALSHLEHIGVVAESKMAFVSDRYPRHFLVATVSHRNILGYRYEKGALIPLVAGDDRIEHLRLMARTAESIHSNNLQALEGR